MHVSKLVLSATLLVLAIGAQLAFPDSLHGQGVSFGRGAGVTIGASPVVVSRDHSTGFGEGPGITLPATVPLARSGNVAFGQGDGIAVANSPTLLAAEPDAHTGVESGIEPNVPADLPARTARHDSRASSSLR
jgi:hypothetical protein